MKLIDLDWLIIIFVANSTNVEDWVEGMRNLLLQLPDINMRTMKAIVLFLWNLAHHWEDIEPHTPVASFVENLSKVFSKWMFASWDQVEDDTNASQSLLEKLVTYHTRIFGGVTPALSQFTDPL